MMVSFGLGLDLIKFSGYLIFMGKDIHLVPVIIRDLGYWQGTCIRNPFKFGAYHSFCRDLDHLNIYDMVFFFCKSLFC